MTNAVELIQRLHEHRRWVNDKLVDAARTLSEEQLRHPYAIGQGSLWKTLLHMYAAEYVWLAALQGDQTPITPGDVPGELPGNQKGDGAVKHLGELVERWKELDGRWKSYLENLTEADLDGIVYKTSTSSGAGKAFGTPCRDVLLHVCTHAQYTTAQANNMLRQTGGEAIPDVMLISLSRQQMNSDDR